MNISRITTSAFILTIVVLTLGFSGCERIVSVISDAQTPQMPDSEIPIGVHVPLTGTWAATVWTPDATGV